MAPGTHRRRPSCRWGTNRLLDRFKGGTNCPHVTRLLAAAADRTQAICQWRCADLTASQESLDNAASGRRHLLRIDPFQHCRPLLTSRAAMDIVALVLAGRVAAAKQCRSALSLSLLIKLDTNLCRSVQLQWTLVVLLLLYNTELIWEKGNLSQFLHGKKSSSFHTGPSNYESARPNCITNRKPIHLF